MSIAPELTGKKVLLFPFDVQADFDWLVDMSARYGQLIFAEETDEAVHHAISNLVLASQSPTAMLWIGYTNQGEAATRIGAVWLTHIDGYSATIAGLHAPTALRIPRKRLGLRRESEAQEAVRLVTDFALTALGLARIESEILARNRLSIALLEGAGFLREGCCVHRLRLAGQPASTVLMAKLKVPQSPVVAIEPVPEHADVGVTHE